MDSNYNIHIFEKIVLHQLIM